MSKCTILAHVRNSNGDIVESKLFKDLLHYTSNRGLAKEYYAVGTNQKFLDMVRDSAKFDENGEITFESLRNLADLNVSREELLSKLNADIDAGTYSYQEAMSKLQNFNRNSQFNQHYMATIRPANGKYQLSVVQRTPANESRLTDEVRKRSIQERVMYYLNKAGVSVEFIENDNKIGGRYSTINAEQTADGLYQLIRVANGENVTGKLAEEAGHFAVGALGNSPLVQRLQAMLTPEVQQSIFGDEDTKVMGTNSAREAAGMLVGKAIEGQIDKRAPWQNLVNRIVNLAKRVFATISGNDVMKATIQAREIADQIASGFMSPEFDGNVETALETKETLYNAKSSYNVQTYRQVVNRLGKTVVELQNISNDALAQAFTNILGQVESGRTRNVANPSPFADNIALEGIAEAVAAFADMVGPNKEIDNILKSVDFANISDFNAHMPENGRKLRQVHTFLRNGKALEALISDAISNVYGKESLVGDVSNVSIVDSLGNAVSINLKQLLQDLKAANNEIQTELFTKETQFFARFCEDSLGSKYVQTSSKILFSKNGKFFLDFKAGNKIHVVDALRFLESDIDLFERFLGSMSNNPDIIGQIADKTTKLANKWADDLTNDCQEQLKVLQRRLQELGIKDTSILFEKDWDDNLTGNIRSPSNWGEYEKDYKEFRDTELEAFKQNTPNLDLMTDFEKGVQWNMWFAPKAKAWHKMNSVFDSNVGRYVPNDQYDNPAFSNLMALYPGLAGWYQDFMQLKTNLDSRLPENSTLPVRMPQFKGTYMNKVQNRRMSESRKDAYKHTLRNELIDMFCESSEDQDFGSNNTYNRSDDEMLFGNQLEYEKEKLHRLPLFGINKLEDMNDLSTDLFHSTLAYAAMANSYAAMSQIVDTLEVGSEVLARRQVKGIEIETERKGEKSRAYNRYLKFLDKQVYGIGSTKHKLGKVIWEKIMSQLSSFSSKYFLGGNIVGGMVNTMTGFNEVFKEMLAGENFSYKDWQKAHKYYYSSFVDNWMDYGKLAKDNKVSLLMRRWNGYGDNRQEFRSWETRHSRIYNMFSQSLFLPYKSGDHYMQSIAYLATAHKIKVYDENGTRMNLFDAYRTVPIDSNNPKAGKKIELPDVLFKSKGGPEEYKKIQSILSQIENVLNASSPFGAVLNLSQEELDYLANKGYNIADLNNTKRRLEEDAYRLTWSVDDESAFMDKCREVNNRMHGIYNNQDKVAFQQSWFGNALLSMRGYALGMLERRFGSSHYSVALGHDVEGSMNTLAKVIMSTFTDSGGFKKTLRAVMLPFGKNQAKAMYQMGFSSNQIRNMRRNFGDALLISFLLLVRMMTAKAEGGDDDDDEEDTMTGLIYYFANRTFREQEAFNLPTGMYNESTSLLDLTPAGVSALIDVTKMGYEFAGSLVSDEEDKDFFYQSSKEGRYEEGDPKWIVHFFRMFPYLRSQYTFEHPYESSKSYEYGRKLKQR